jgi:hypothetical protein
MNHLNPITKFHTYYRELRSRGLSKCAALDQAKRKNWSEYKEYCALQDSGVVLQSLDVPDVGRVMSIISTGKLL